MSKYGKCMEVYKILSNPLIKSSIPFHTLTLPYSIPKFSFHFIPFYSIADPAFDCRFEIVSSVYFFSPFFGDAAMLCCVFTSFPDFLHALLFLRLPFLDSRLLFMV